MILGIDHLALSCTDCAAADGTLAQANFARVFVQLHTPNSAAKRRLLNNYQPHHDLALYRPLGGGYAIELTCHGGELGVPAGPFLPVIRGRIPGTVAATSAANGPDWPTVLSQIYGTNAYLRAWPSLSAMLWSLGPEADCPPAAEAIALPVRDVRREADFWTALSFSVVQENAPRWACLRISAPVAAWSGDLVLAHADDEPGALLDAAGCTCLALLCTRMEDDERLLEQAGARDITDRFSTAVDGRELAVRLFRSPCGAIGELIQLPRAGKTVLGGDPE